MHSYSLYDWQRECLQAISQSNSVIVSAPTGSGKSLVAYLWANVFEPQGRVIFTAPIKALSNERYLDLKKNGVDVGIETGDFKKNTDAKVICCTQEIYTKKYACIPYQTVVIDEFHYVTQDPQRARAYIDGIVSTHETSRVLIMSATFGDANKVKDYLNKITGRQFVLYHTDFRPTKLVFMENPVDFENIKDAIVFAFSKSGVISVAQALWRQRKKLPKNVVDNIQTIAQKLGIDNEELLNLSKRGIGVYYGSMLPKEKLFVEVSFRKRLIDVVVGTDALALGVNMPAKYVIFAQLAKYYEGPISKNAFLQMAGRAGRKGYWDNGFVSYIQNSFVESYEYETSELYLDLLKRPQEDFAILLSVSIPDLLNGRTAEEETEYIVKHSYPVIDYDYVYKEAYAAVNAIESAEKAWPGIKQIMMDTYFHEIPLSVNIAVAREFLYKDVVQAGKLFELIHYMQKSKSIFYSLLQTHRLIMQLPTHFRQRVSNKEEIVESIMQIDPTVFRFDEFSDL
jgi:superfamily II RNA helicase